MQMLIALDDAMGHPTLAINPSDTILAVKLAGGTPRQVDVPVDAKAVLFSATGPFWAKVGGPATVPAADILDGSAPELNPLARRIGTASVIGLAAAAATTVTLSFYG